MANNTNIKDENKENNVQNPVNDVKQNNVVNTDNNKQDENKEKQEKAKVKKDITYIVNSPVKDFVGIVAGVHFAYGKAEVKEGWILNWFIEKGYKVEEKE